MSLPADLRKRLGLVEGGAVFVEETEDGIVLRTAAQTVAHAQAIAKRFAGGGNAVLRETAHGGLTPLVTPALILEYEAVLKRPEQRLAHGLGLRDIDRFLAAFASGCEPVEVSFQWRPQLADPNDEMVLEAAVNGRADALVTHNVRHFDKGAQQCSEFGYRGPENC